MSTDARHPDVPPPPGQATPVPADAAARAAASGRAPARVQQAASPVADRLADAPPRSVAPAYAAPSYPAAAYAPPGYVAPAYVPPGYAPTADAQPYHIANPYLSASQLHASAPPPRIRWTRRQTRTALLSSWVGQTVMALAVHLGVAAFFVVGLGLLLQLDPAAASVAEADSLTSTVARWSRPDRVGAASIIVLLAVGALLVLGWLISALWAKADGLAKPHRSTWLAWLSTTVLVSLIGVAVWPMALTGALFTTALGSSLSTGSLWSALLGLLGLAVIATGLVGMLFGWMFLAAARPRIDAPELARAAEQAARARDPQQPGAVGEHAWRSR